MAVLHIYTKNGKIYCTAKEPFLGKEKPLPNLPAFSELFSSGVTCVVFKLPSLLKTRNFKLICFALLSFVLSELLGVAYTQIRNPDSNLSLLGRS